MAHITSIRLIAAASALAMALGIALTAAQNGHLRLGAGGLELVLERGEDSLIAVKVGERSCPPECGFIDVSFKRVMANPTLLILGVKDGHDAKDFKTVEEQNTTKGQVA